MTNLVKLNFLLQGCEVLVVKKLKDIMLYVILAALTFAAIQVICSWGQPLSYHSSRECKITSFVLVWDMRARGGMLDMKVAQINRDNNSLPSTFKIRIHLFVTPSQAVWYRLQRIPKLNFSLLNAFHSITRTRIRVHNTDDLGSWLRCTHRVLFIWNITVWITEQSESYGS